MDHGQKPPILPHFTLWDQRSFEQLRSQYSSMSSWWHVPRISQSILPTCRFCNFAFSPFLTNFRHPPLPQGQALVLLRLLLARRSVSSYSDF
jgi:hypothetical protein